MCLPMERVASWLELNGYTRASTVREPGDYALRGGILDLYAPGMDVPVRLDFFGDQLETIRSFDPETQRTQYDLRALDLVPVSEFQLTTETIRRFRLGYVEAFGAATRDDLLYESVSEGRRYPGMEHWLPLFHEHLDTLLDYLDGTPVALEPLADDVAHERISQINDYYDARHNVPAGAGGVPYKPLPPQRLYLTEEEWRDKLERSKLARLTPFAVPEQNDSDRRYRHAAGAQLRGRSRRAECQCVRRGDAGMSPDFSATTRMWSSRCGAKARATAWAMCCAITASPT